MWKFREKVCPRCGIDLAGVKPKRIREDVPQPYSVCPTCGHIRPVIEVKPVAEVEPEPEPESEVEEPSEPEPTASEAEPTESEPAS